MAKNPVSSESSDEELMQAVSLDNTFAFELLYRRYKGPILSFTCRMLQNYQKAEDATQEIFLRILKKKNTYDTSRKFSGWLYRIAANTCIDELRRLKFSGSNEDKKYENASVRTADEPYRELERAEKETIIKNALNRLTKEQKTIVIFHKYQDLTYQEIAEIFDKDFNWVKWQLKTAYDALFEILKSCLK